MKNRIITGVVFIILGSLAALGPYFIFRICEQSGHHGEVSACFYTGKAELGAGLLLGVFGIFLFVFKDTGVRAGLILAGALLGILIVLLPHGLTGVCAGAMMRCRIEALPGLTVTGILTTLFAGVNVVYLLKITGQEIR
jgi:hypothetical protein